MATSTPTTKTHETVMITCSPEFKDALGTFAAHMDISVSEAVRQSVASYIGYDLINEVKPVRRGTKYATPEARKAAQLARAKARRAITKQLLDAYQKADNEVAIKALIDSLRAEAI